MAIMMAVRIMCLIAGTSLLTYTTSPIELTDAIEVLMGPLKKIKVPVHGDRDDDDHRAALYPNPD